MNIDFDLKKDEIIKHNRMIESAFGSLGLNSFKLLMFLSSQFSVENMTELEDRYKLDFKNSIFLKSIGYESDRGYTEIKKYLKELRKVDIELPIWENGKEVGEVMTGFIEKSKSYKPNTDYVKKGITTIWITKELMPYLYKLKVEKETTILRYELMKKFESYFSARIYELLIRWKNTTHKKREFELKELKEKLGVSDKYNDFRNFEQFVLKVAKKEINNISDIEIDYKKLTKGEIKGKGRRPITHIKFTFKLKNELEKEEVFTEKQIEILMEIAKNKVLNTDKTAEDFYNYTYSLTVENCSNKKGYYKYIKRILEEDKVFLGQTSLFTNPNVREVSKQNNTEAVKNNPNYIEPPTRELTEEEKKKAEESKKKIQEQMAKIGKKIK